MFGDYNLRCIFLLLLRSIASKKEIDSQDKNLITDDLLEELFKLAKRQDLAHLVCDALEKNDIKVCDKLLSKFKNEKNVAIFRSNQVDYELEQISKALEEEKIDFILLKGAIIRNLYPEKWMRTSCDIDVLIKEQDVKRATRILEEKLSYKFTGKTTHDLQFLTESGLPVELHFSLLKSDGEVSKILEKVWDNVKETSLSQKVINEEFFYFYHVAHMATHFKLGGCGLRPFIDLYLLDKNLKIDKQALNELLKNSGLTIFEKEVLSVSKHIFENSELTKIGLGVIGFVLNAGMYGDIKNLAIINQSKKGSKGRYILSRIFVSYSALKLRYPVLEKHPILFPFYQVRRWFNLLNKKSRKLATYEYKALNETKENEKSFVEKIFSELKI